MPAYLSGTRGLTACHPGGVSDPGSPATPDSWPHTPLSQPQPIPNPRRTWSDDDWGRIRRGNLPTSGDPNWFAFVEGDRLSVHEGATGAAVYRARFQRGLPGWRIVPAEVEADPSAHRLRSPEEESADLQNLIENVLLRR